MIHLKLHFGEPLQGIRAINTRAKIISDKKSDAFFNSFKGNIQCCSLVFT